MLKFIDGGVCAAQGFQAVGIHVGVKTHANWKKDVALIVSDVDCAASAVFTKNVVKAAPIHVDKKHLADGKARAIIANSGNANACAPHGEENAEKMCAAAAKAIGCKAEDVLVSSTGVIGQTMVRVADTTDTAKLYANAQAGKDTLVLYAAGNDEQFTITALFDNLGKGASGAAVQNMNLMLGFEETTGLNL